MNKLFKKPISLTFEFQISTLKLLMYNFVIVLLIANQNVIWKFKFSGTDPESGLTHELLEPEILTKFGFCFRFLTVIMNIFAVATVLKPEREKRNFLLPCIIWNFYTITAVSENVFEISWSMIQLDVPFKQFATIIFVALFMLAFQSKLTIQVVRFYEYLNYV